MGGRCTVWLSEGRVKNKKESKKKKGQQ